jgi:hypothetical protein
VVHEGGSDEEQDMTCVEIPRRLDDWRVARR